MLVRIGFEIIVSCKAPVPMLMALSTHSEFPGPIIGSDKVRSSGPGTITEYLDGFGNRMSRTVASAGLTTYWSDCVATVDGLPDKLPINAIIFAPTVPDKNTSCVDDVEITVLE